MYFRSTVNTATVSYQYCSYLYYCKIHLHIYIRCYFPLNYDDPLILMIHYLKLSWDFDFLTSIESVLLWYFQNKRFSSSQRNP